MALVVVPESFFIGAATPYFRALGGTGPWTSLGVTVDDAAAHIASTWFRPDNINGVLGPIMGLDILRRVEARVEFSIPGITGANMAKILPGSQSVDQLITDAGGSPLSTTLAAAAAPGDTTIKVTAVTNGAVNDFVRIESGANIELRQIDVVGTAGAGGTGLQFRDPLLFAHANGSAVVETVGDGRSVITAPTVRRQPTSAYFDWALVAPAGSKYAELRLLNAISETEDAEIGFGDETLAAARVMIGARYAGSALSTSPWQLIVPT